MISTSALVFWGLAAVTLVGGLTVAFTRDVMRLALGLGAFLLAVAGWFLYFGQTFLAVAQVFVYVGGVLVLMLFAIMLVQRSEVGKPDLSSRHAIDSLMVAVSVFALLVGTLRPIADRLSEQPVAADANAIAPALLGSLLPQFEMAGVLLLAALVAALVVLGGDRE